MSDTLEQLRIRERDMELEAITLRARVEELRRIIALLEAEPPRRQRQQRQQHNATTNDTSSLTVVNPGPMPWDDEDTAA